MIHKWQDNNQGLWFVDPEPEQDTTRLVGFWHFPESQAFPEGMIIAYTIDTDGTLHYDKELLAKVKESFTI